MRIHLTTAVGDYVKVLPHMLRHYRGLGVDSFFVHVNRFTDDDPILDEVRAVTRDAGCEVTSVSTAGKLLRGNREIHRAIMARHPDDWFIVADQDELQVYPGVLRDILETCDRRGYHSIEGTFIDRLAPGGVFAGIDPHAGIWEQFPIAALVTAPLLGGFPRKVAAAKGFVELNEGQHAALNGNRCPVEECHVAVNHLKWTAGIVTRLRTRARLLRDIGLPYSEESERFIRYVAEHGERIDLDDPRFFAREAAAMDLARLREISEAQRLIVLT